jgi:hypothetical protein
MLIIATVLGLDNMDHLLYLVGEFMKVLASPLRSQDMARLDGMLVVVVVDVLMGVKMLVLVGRVLVLSKAMIMLLILVRKHKPVIVTLVASRLGVNLAVVEVFEVVWQDEANGRGGYAKRNERECQSHGQGCPRERERGRRCPL